MPEPKPWRREIRLGPTLCPASIKIRIYPFKRPLRCNAIRSRFSASFQKYNTHSPKKQAPYRVNVNPGQPAYDNRGHYQRGISFVDGKMQSPVDAFTADPSIINPGTKTVRQYRPRYSLRTSAVLAATTNFVVWPFSSEPSGLLNPNSAGNDPSSCYTISNQMTRTIRQSRVISMKPLLNGIEKLISNL